MSEQTEDFTQGSPFMAMPKYGNEQERHKIQHSAKTSKFFSSQ